jgi:hypothetical protein
VEVGVQIVERWIVAALRHHHFYSVADINEAIAELLQRLNHRCFRKREGTRASLFAELDRPALQPLPVERYELAEWKNARANIDYHVEIDRHYYSVPYQLVGRALEARFTATTVEIFHRSVRVASHPRSSAAYRHTTNPEHPPKSHQAHLEWTPSRLIHWTTSRWARRLRRSYTPFSKRSRIRRWAIALASASCAWPRLTPMSGWRRPASELSNCGRSRIKACARS